MKKVYCFVMMCLCIVGAIGGIGYTAFNGEYHITIGLLALSYTAWPEFKEYVIKLML